MKCEELVRELSNYLDGEVSAGLHQRIDDHLRECGSCRELLDEMSGTVGLLADDSLLEVPPGYSRRLYRKLDAQLHGHASGNAAVDIALGVGRDSVPLGSHLIYFWQTADEFERGVQFLYPGLEGNDHCVVECDATVHEVAPDHGERVSRDYFAGAPPFKEAKNRNDIPDSFIFQVIKDLEAVHDPLYVIVHDGALFDAAASLPNVKVFKDLDSFITTPECQEALQELQTEIVNENLERAQGLLSNQKEQLEGMVDADMYEALSLRPFKTEDLTGIEEEASVVAVYGTPKVTFDFSGMEYYGGSEIGIPFESSVECDLTFPIYKGSYFMLNSRPMKRITVEELNEHYFQATGRYTLEVKGILSVEFETEKLNDPDITDEQIEDAILNGEHTVEVTERDVAFEVVDNG